MKRTIFPLIFIALSQALALTANAAVTIRIFEDGQDVAVTWSGSFNTNAATFAGQLPLPVGGVGPSTGFISTTPGDGDVYRVSATEPPVLGPGADRTDWDTSSGDTVAISVEANLLLPRGYISGAALSGSARANNTTLNAMGLTPGTYTLESTNGGVTDSVSIVIESPAAQATATPVPTLPVFGLALLAAAIAALGRRAIRR